MDRSQEGTSHLPSRPGAQGHPKLLLMSSAKMMLVRRAGWDRRACTTACREHCCSLGPSGSILATSGRVDDPWQEDENLLCAVSYSEKHETRSQSCSSLSGDQSQTQTVPTRLEMGSSHQTQRRNLQGHSTELEISLYL